MPGQARPFAVSVAVSIKQHAAVTNLPPALLWPRSLYQLLTCSELQSGQVRLEQCRTFSLFRGALRVPACWVCWLCFGRVIDRVFVP